MASGAVSRSSDRYSHCELTARRCTEVQARSGDPRDLRSQYVHCSCYCCSPTLTRRCPVNHNRTGILKYDINTPESTIFAANTSCVVTPEVTDGPYYVTGEIIRQNVKEAQYCDGVDLHLEVQYLNIETCEPVEGIYVDIWNANATGVYSGISTSGNYAADGYNSTYLRQVYLDQATWLCADESRVAASKPPIPTVS